MLQIRVVTPTEVRDGTPDELEELIAGPDLVWIDVPTWDDETSEILGKVLGLHARALHDCAVANLVPKVHVYPDHEFVVLHAAAPGKRGHVHHVELDQFIGDRYLVTVHGPLDPALSQDVAMIETDTVARRLESGRFRPTSAAALSHAVVTALTNRLREFVTTLTREVWRLEEAVTAGHLGDPEQFLEELFETRHGLLATRTMAGLGREVHGRMSTLQVFGEGSDAALLTDLEDQFRRIAALADCQREYLQGVIEFYQTRTGTKMTIAAERLAVIAGVTLPITALSSIVGMNVIYFNETQVGSLIVLVVVMVIMSIAMMVWAHRQGWW